MEGVEKEEVPTTVVNALLDLTSFLPACLVFAAAKMVLETSGKNSQKTATEG